MQSTTSILPIWIQVELLVTIEMQDAITKVPNMHPWCKSKVYVNDIKIHVRNKNHNVLLEVPKVLSKLKNVVQEEALKLSLAKKGNQKINNFLTLRKLLESNMFELV